MSSTLMVRDQILASKARRDEGLYNTILPPFPRLAQHWPGWEQQKYYIVTANSGVGKSQLTRFTTIRGAANFCKANNIPYEMHYFSLEETKTRFVVNIICSHIFDRFGYRMDAKELFSKGEKIASDETLRMVDAVAPLVEETLENVFIYDEPMTPFAIFDRMREVANRNGDFYFNDTKVEIRKGERVLYNRYVPYDRQKYIFCIVDNINILQIEEGKDKRTNIEHFSSHYCLQRMRDQLGMTIIAVQQQKSAKEQVESDFRGRTLEQKLEPSLDGLGDATTTQRDADMVFGLFSPHRYKIAVHEGYRIDKLRDNYRCLRILKDRDYGLEGKFATLFFDGAANRFEELPTPEEFTLNPSLYQRYCL